MKVTKSLAVLGIATLVLVGTGCGKAIDKVSKKATEKVVEKSVGDNAKVDIDGDGEGFSIETDEGGFSMQSGTDVPDEWPDDFTVPQGFSIEGTTSMQVDGGSHMTIYAEGSADPKDVYKDYVAWAEKSGYELASQMESGTGDSYYGNATFDMGGIIGSVMVSSDADDITNIAMTVREATDDD